MGQIVKKKANQLVPGDKILGQTNFYFIDSVKPSALTGSTYPVIEITDSHGIKKVIETGANERFQDHVYEVELPVKLEEKVEPKKKKVVKKTKKVVAKKVAGKKKTVKK